MTVASELRKCGLLTYVDSAEIIHHRYARTARVRARNFKLFRRRVARLPNKAAGVYAARLVALNMVLPSQIDLAAVTEPYSQQGQPTIDWKPDGGPRIERRQLLSLTNISRPTVPSGQLPSAQLVDLLKTDCHYKQFSAKDSLAELEADMCHWAHRNLSGPMAAHVTALAPMWAVSRDTLARLEFKAVRKLDLTTVNEEFELKLASFMSAAEEANASSDDMVLIKYAVQLVTYDGGKTDEENYYHWITSLIALRSQVRESSPATALLICWMIDLFESGTHRAPNSKIETRIAYVRSGVIRIWIALEATKKRPNDLSAEELQAAYLSIFTDGASSDPKTTGSAVSNFQHYCHEVWGFPEVVLGISKHIPKPMPCVQIVHPHERALAVSWLTECKGADTYALEIAALQIELLDHWPTRPEELSHARLGNVDISDDVSLAETELYPAPGETFKNKGSHRSATISNPSLVRRLNAWLDRRRADGATDIHFLFGIDTQPNLYRPSLVKALQRIALKSACGDSSMTLYALRHTSSTCDFVESQRRECTNLNYHYELAERKGHISPPMGIEFYSHCYERGLANELKRAARRDIHFIDKDAETLTDLSAVNARSRAARSKGKLTISDVIWNEIESQSSLLSPPQVGHLEVWASPEAPTFSIARTDGISPMAFCRALKKLQTCTPAEASIYCDLPIETVQKISDLVYEDVRLQQNKKTAARRKNELPVTSFSEALNYLGISVGSATQQKYLPLRLTLSKSIDLQSTPNLFHCFWDLVKSKTYVRLDKPELAAELVVFLKNCRLHATDFLVRFQPCKKDLSARATLMTCIQKLFSATWNELPTPEEDELDHDSRPAAYLLLPARKGDHSPRSVEVRGLITLLYCCKLFSSLMKDENNANS